FFHGTVQVLVLDLRLAIFGSAASFDIFLEVDEDIHVVLQQLRRKPDRVGRSNGAVGPNFKRELVVIRDLPKTGGFNGVVALADWRVDGIDWNESNAEILVEILVGRNVTAATLEAHFH